MLFRLDTKLEEVWVRFNRPIEEDREAAVGVLVSLGGGDFTDEDSDMMITKSSRFEHLIAL